MTPQTETFFMWKELRKIEGAEDEGPRFLTPWSNPMRYEHSFNFLCTSVAHALAVKKEWGAEDEEDWVLVTETSVAVGQMSFANEEAEEMTFTFYNTEAQQKERVLKTLADALKNATILGVLDDLSSDCHPNSINEFCNAVNHANTKE